MFTNGFRVLVLPDPNWSERALVVESLQRIGPTLDIDSPAEPRHVCATLVGAELAPPLVIVAHEHTCHLLPAVALSLRTQHRDTCGYVLVDPDAPPSTDIWPEAPVCVVSTSAQNYTSKVSLRGWPVKSTDSTGVGVAASRAVEEFLQLPAADG